MNKSALVTGQITFSTGIIPKYDFVNIGGTAGYIDAFTIYNAVLSDTQINSLYNNPNLPSTF